MHKKNSSSEPEDHVDWWYTGCDATILGLQKSSLLPEHQGKKQLPSWVTLRSEPHMKNKKELVWCSSGHHRGIWWRILMFEFCPWRIRNHSLRQTRRIQAGSKKVEQTPCLSLGKWWSLPHNLDRHTADQSKVCLCGITEASVGEITQKISTRRERDDLPPPHMRILTQPPSTVRICSDVIHDTLPIAIAHHSCPRQRWLCCEHWKIDAGQAYRNPCFFLCRRKTLLTSLR